MSRGDYDDRDDRFDDDRGRDDRDDDRSRMQRARDKVKGPAIALLVTAILSFLGIGIGVVQYFTTLPGQFVEEKKKIEANPQFNQQQKQDMVKFMDAYEKGVYVGLPILWVVVGIMTLLALVGALKMKNLASGGWAKTSAWLSMLPCTSGCCLLGLPFGIWALMAMSDRDVKWAFNRGSVEPRDDYDDRRRDDLDDRGR